MTTASTNQCFWPDSGHILRHQYGISVTESQTFLLAKRPQRRRARRNGCFRRLVGWGWGLIWVWLGGGGGGRLLTFSAFRMGAYSKWALIRGWGLIQINTVTLLKMWPHYSQSSRENATPSSRTSASYKEVPFPRAQDVFTADHPASLGARNLSTWVLECLTWVLQRVTQGFTSYSRSSRKRPPQRFEMWSSPEVLA